MNIAKCFWRSQSSYSLYLSSYPPAYVIPRVQTQEIATPDALTPPIKQCYKKFLCSSPKHS